MESDYDSNKQLVTWEKYHCNAVINDCIKCLKCKGKLYLNLKQNKLICEECSFKASPDEMDYLCLVCKKGFKANLKIYNPIEFHVIKVSIKNAVLTKIACKPDYLPCCKQDTKNIKNFCHKKECKGTLYSGKWINNNILVCSKCKILSEVDKFVWTCPLCYQRFKSKNSSANLNLNKIQVNKDKDSKEASISGSKDSRSKSPNVRSNVNVNNYDKNYREGITNNITNLIINNNININNINYNERGSSGSIGTNLASSPNITNDLQNLLKKKNLDIDFENLKAEAGKFKNIISNMNLDKISENNPLSNNRNPAGALRHQATATIKSQ
jgi:Zn finger protein HypA/HybF involved in hydrogenase expression